MPPTNGISVARVIALLRGKADLVDGRVPMEQLPEGLGEGEGGGPHALTGAQHTASGLTSGHVLRATGSTSFAFGAIQDGDIPAAIARDSEVTAAVAAAVSTHEGASDPHTGYQKESEKNNANGYCGLDASGLVADVRLPSSIARDSEVAAAVTAHEAAGDPHTGYQRESEKAQAGGYASLDGSTKVPIAQLPTGTSSTTVCAGDDSRLSDSRAPSGSASGDLGGSFPGPTVTQARGLRETAGPTTLAMAGVSDGQFLKRSGATVVGAALVDADIPATIARDSEVSGAVSAHAAAGDPHTGYQLESEKAQASGYASLDGSTKVPIAQLPTGTSSSTVCIGNDSRLSDSRAPTGSASGDLVGTYPSPTTPLARGSFAPASFTIADGRFGLMVKQLQLVSSDRATLAGTARLVLMC